MLLSAAVLWQAPAYAQDSVVDTLSFLLTTQAVPTGDFIKDQQSAEITRDTIGRLLLTELTTTPLSSSSGGFSYRFNPTLGTVERASESFGAFFTERSLTVGNRRASVGVQAQVARYSNLDDYSLRDGTFITTARFLNSMLNAGRDGLVEKLLRTRLLNGSSPPAVPARYMLSAQVRSKSHGHTSHNPVTGFR
jgi:hypothetical protein